MQPQFTLVASSTKPHAALDGLPAKENPGSPAFADMLSGASVDKGTEPSFEKLGIAKSDYEKGTEIRAGQGLSDTESESSLGLGLIGLPAFEIAKNIPASPQMPEFAEAPARPSKILPEAGKILPPAIRLPVPLAGTKISIVPPAIQSDAFSAELETLPDDAKRAVASAIATGQVPAPEGNKVNEASTSKFNLTDKMSKTLQHVGACEVVVSFKSSNRIRPLIDDTLTPVVTMKPVDTFKAIDGTKASASNVGPLGKISDIVGQAGACEVIVSFKPSNPTRALRVAAAERALLDGKMDTSTLAALSTVTLDVKGVDTGKVGGAVASGPAGTGPALVLPAGIGNAPPAAKLEAMLAGSDAPAKPTPAIVDGTQTSAGKADADVRLSARSVAESSQQNIKHVDRTKQFDSALPEPRAADRLTPSQAGPGGPANGSGFPTSDLVAAPSTSRFFANSAPTGVELARQIAEVSQELAKSIDADGNTSGKLTLEHQVFGAVALRLTRDHHSGLEVRVDGSPELHAALATSLRNERGENRPQSHNHQHSQAGAEAGHMSGGHGGNTYGSGKENEPRFRLDGLRNDAGRQMPDNETEGRKDRHSPRSRGVFA